MPKIVLIFSFALLGIVFSATALAQTSSAPSPADCQAYAKRVEMDSGSMLGGAARGAAGGAIFGAIVGNSKGAKRGAVLGTVVGGARSAAGRSEAYRRAYDNCMAGKVKW